MSRRGVIASYRVALAVLVLAAIAVQAADLSARGILNPINFLSYFTIQSNLIGVAVFLLGVARWRAAPTRGVDLVRGAAVVYLTVTLIVFAVLLSDTDVDTAIPWVDTVLHRLFPVVAIADWLIDPPRNRISLRTSLAWLAYPLVWTAYTLIRGPIAGWYPYPFLDPANGGYPTVAAYVVAILVFGAILCAIVAAVGSALGGRRLGARLAT